jgi:hypothetical protein
MAGRQARKSHGSHRISSLLKLSSGHYSMEELLVNFGEAAARLLDPFTFLKTHGKGEFLEFFFERARAEFAALVLAAEPAGAASGRAERIEGELRGVDRIFDGSFERGARTAFADEFPGLLEALPGELESFIEAAERIRLAADRFHGERGRRGGEKCGQSEPGE